MSLTLELFLFMKWSLDNSLCYNQHLLDSAWIWAKGNDNMIGCTTCSSVSTSCSRSTVLVSYTSPPVRKTTSPQWCYLRTLQSPPSMAATLLTTRLMAVLQPSGYSIFHGGDTPIQLSLPWRSCSCQCLNTETSARGNRGFTTETLSISYTFRLYIRLVVTL